MTARKILILSILGLTTALTQPQTEAHAEAGDWLMRARVLAVAPIEGGTVSINGAPEISTAYVPEIDFTYFVTDKIGIELILATAEHEVQALGTDLGDVDLGDVMLLPPTLSLQYHPLAGEKFSPYFGVGVNLTFFYSADLPAGSTLGNIDYGTSLGVSFQAGFDVSINDDWFFNVDAKKLLLGTDVSIAGGAVTANVDINPWILGAGFGYRF